MISALQDTVHERRSEIYYEARIRDASRPKEAEFVRIHHAIEGKIVL
jgi:hypothetical protein